MLENLQAAHSRHEHVKQNKVKPLGPDPLERPGPSFAVATLYPVRPDRRDKAMPLPSLSSTTKIDAAARVRRRRAGFKGMILRDGIHSPVSIAILAC